MQINLNGTPRDVPDNLTLSSLLKHLKIDANTVLVELNREVVQKGTYDQVSMADGDSLELVRFVGGG